MSSNNPDITASNIVTDVENKLGDTNLDTADYLPWISYSYQRIYSAIVANGQWAKEYYFGDVATITLTPGDNEFSLKTEIPRFGGTIKVEILYGASGDEYVLAKKLPSLANWDNQNQVSTDYRSKLSAVYYIIGDTFGIIPTPPSDEGNVTVKVWYVKRPYQITDGTDVIDLPYRYMWPINDYVQAKAIQAENEDYISSIAIEDRFNVSLERITESVANEKDENDDTNMIQISANSRLRSNPIRRI